MLRARHQRRIETPGHGSSSGFTLVELMVTVAVLAIISAIAFPSFTSLMNSNRLAGAANDLVGDLQYARSEAIRRNSRITVCASSDVTTCAGGAGGWQSWIVMVDNPAPAADGSVAGRSCQGRLAGASERCHHGQWQQRRVPGRWMARQANGSLLTASLGTCMVTTSPPENVRVVRIASGSRVSTSKVAGGGACAAPGN